MKEYEKRKYILDNKNNYTIENNKDLINQSNKFRKENNIDDLNWDIEIYFEDLIMDKYSELFLSDYENIFKLSNRKYLLKYPFDDFQKRFKNREKNLTDILLNDNLNKIIIIKKKYIIFILIYGINLNRYNNIYHIYNEYSEHSQTKICVAKHFRESYIYEDKYYEC